MVNAFYYYKFDENWCNPGEIFYIENLQGVKCWVYRHSA